jgi:hypothetical protein
VGEVCFVFEQILGDVADDVSRVIAAGKECLSMHKEAIAFASADVYWLMMRASLKGFVSPS